MAYRKRLIRILMHICQLHMPHTALKQTVRTVMIAAPIWVFSCSDSILSTCKKENTSQSPNNPPEAPSSVLLGHFQIIQA